MSDDDRMVGPLAALIRLVNRRDAADEERASTFARGLALGALVGAAIAGSTIWQRRHPRTDSKPVASTTDERTGI
jgi:hypothetical protein